MDAEIMIKVVLPFVTLVIGALFQKWLQDKPKLFSYLGHTFAITTEFEKNKKVSVHTHSMVLQNVGRKKAKNVRVNHANLPNFQVCPDKKSNVDDLPNGGKAIVFDDVVPGETITINYLYIPPLLYTGVNTNTTSDDGVVKIVPMHLTQMYSRTVNVLIGLVTLIGVGTIVYYIAKFVKVVAGSI